MKIKIGIPVPNINALTEETKASLSGLDTDVFSVVHCQGATIARMRNSMITQSKLMYQDCFDFDYFLSLDSDIQFTEENIYQLIDGDKLVISGLYPYKDNRKNGVGGMFDCGIVTENIVMDSKGIHKVDWVGSGFLLINSNVFKHLEYPYFRNEIIRKEIDGEINQDMCSEDIGFALNCKRNGVDIWCNCDCKVNHIKGDGHAREKKCK